MKNRIRSTQYTRSFGFARDFAQGRRMVILALFVIAVMALAIAPAAYSAPEIVFLHEFTGGANDGSKPYESILTLDSGTLYGMTESGGDSDRGTIFSIGMNGTGFTLLHEFAAGTDDGGWPQGSLLSDSGTLYGMTPYGGDSDSGTVFSIGTDGTGFTLLHEFAGGAGDGSYPCGDLTSGSGTFYGTTESGGDSDNGTVFSIAPDGTGFTLLHEFAGGVDDGSWPQGSLLSDSDMLYGMTASGGDSDNGTIFSMTPDGTGFSLLHEFDGGWPRSSLTADSGTLYGMTYKWGTSPDRIFSMEADGTGYTVLHEFAGGVSDGSSAYGNLTLYSGTLYGMTKYGGDSNLGTVFSISTDGTGFGLLHEFAGGVGDGSYPYSSLIANSGKLFGMTSGGGDSNLGTVFFIYIAPHIFDYIDIAANTDFSMGYTTDEIDQLYMLYFQGKEGLDPDTVTIGGTMWQYYDTLPGQEGHSIGDAYIYEGMKYIYLGSGIGEPSGGGAPEIPVGAVPFVSAICGFVYVTIRGSRRK